MFEKKPSVSVNKSCRMFSNASKNTQQFPSSGRVTRNQTSTFHTVYFRKCELYITSTDRLRGGRPAGRRRSSAMWPAIKRTNVTAALCSCHSVRSITRVKRLLVISTVSIHIFTMVVSAVCSVFTYPDTHDLKDQTTPKAMLHAAVKSDWVRPPYLFNPLKSNGNYIPTSPTINDSLFFVFVFRLILTVNSDYFLKQR
jgi:hypothetical protein